MNREVSTLLRCMLQAASITEAEYKSIRELYMREVMEGMQHAQDLADQIEHLGEMPKLDPDLTPPPRDIKTMLARDTEYQRKDVRNYRRLSELAENGCLYFLKLKMEVRSGEKDLYGRIKHHLMGD